MTEDFTPRIIVDYEIDRFTGSITTNTGVTYTWEYEASFKCCESFGSELAAESICEEALRGATLEWIGLEKCNEPPPGMDPKEYMDSGYFYNLVIIVGGGNYIRTFYNFQNGYYDHNLDLYRDDKHIMNVSI